MKENMWDNKKPFNKNLFKTSVSLGKYDDIIFPTKLEIIFLTIKKIVMNKIIFSIKFTPQSVIILQLFLYVVKKNISTNIDKKLLSAIFTFLNLLFFALLKDKHNCKSSFLKNQYHILLKH